MRNPTANEVIIFNSNPEWLTHLVGFVQEANPDLMPQPFDKIYTAVPQLKERREQTAGVISSLGLSGSLFGGSDNYTSVPLLKLARYYEIPRAVVSGANEKILAHFREELALEFVANTAKIQPHDKGLISWIQSLRAAKIEG